MNAFIKLSVGLVMACTLINTAFSQTSNQNYIKREFAQEPVKTESDFSALNDANERFNNVAYIDGMGRVIQQIDVKASPDMKDLVSFTKYDQMGRVPREYMPYGSGQNNNGHYRTSPVVEQDLYFNNLTIIDSLDRDFPFADNVFDNSPLNRVLEKGKPGKDWQVSQNHTAKTSFRANSSSIGVDYVHKWSYDPQNDQFMHAGLFAPDELLVNEMQDENGHTSIEYRDKLNRVVLIRNQIDQSSVHSDPTSWANLYYFYDVKGNLRHVLQPEGVKSAASASWNIHSGNTLDNFAFSYKYNERNQVVEKKIPGAGWIYIVYDPLDRPVLTQDAAMRANNPNDWVFQKYDALNRPIISGVYTCPATHSMVQMQEQIMNGCNDGSYALFEGRTSANFSQQHGYTDQAFPPTATISAYHQVMWYDDYDFNLDGIMDRVYQFEPKIPGNNSFWRVKGKPTGTKVWVLNPENDMPDSLLTVTFYDSRDREVQIFSQNHLGGYDVMTNQYDFTGKLLTSVHRHIKGTDEIMVMKEYTYDHRGRALEVFQTNSRNGDEDDPVLLVKYTYDDLGMIAEKNLHSTDQGAHFTQSVDYKYNIQGWMTDINQINAQCGSGTTDDPVIGIKLNEIFVDFNPVVTEGNTVINIRVRDHKTVSFLNQRKNKTYEREANMATEKKLVLNGIINSSAFNSQFTSGFDNTQVVEGNYASIRNQITGDMFSFFSESNLDSLTIDAIADQVSSMMEDEFANIYGDDDNEDLFSMKFHFNDGFTQQNAQAVPLFDGNIAGLEWQSFTDCGVKSYAFEYDAMDRLKEAHYAEQALNGNWSVNSGRYSVNNIQYDANGNIQSLLRKGKNGFNYGNLDDLTYTYQGNRLIKVVDNLTYTNTGTDQFVDGNLIGNDYSYDAGGNLTHDLNKGITVSYNHLNKPFQVDFTNGDQLAYIYDATGVKLRKKVTSNNSSQRDYIMGFVYEDTVLSYFAHEEGRVLVDADGFNFEYNLTDHLGNVRVSFRAESDGSPEVLQEDHYYPFGMRLGGLSYQSGLENNHLFNGKELEEELDLGWYDYGFRWYMADLGRFVSVDPLAEKYMDWSSFIYTLDNPINFIDPDGRVATDPPYKIDNGVLSGPNVTSKITKSTYRPPMESVKAIVLHRTVSNNAESAINHSINMKGRVGFHIIIDKDGAITQINNFNNRANHVGKQKGGSGVSNYNSIGIEVVGMSLDIDGNPTMESSETVSWESLTSAQIESTVNVLSILLSEFDLDTDVIYPHEDVSKKTEGEGRTVYNSTIEFLEQLISKDRDEKAEEEIFEIHKKNEHDRKFYY
jgi:RHS repeat-associated protein